VEVIEDFSTGYHSRNGGGDLIITDGNLPIIDLRRIEVPETAVGEHTDSRDKRPAQTVFGAGVAFLRGLAFLPIAFLLFLLPAQYVTGVDIEGGRPALIFVGSMVALVALIDIGLAIAVFVGRNWARIVLMLSSVLTTMSAFIGNANGSEAVTLATSLPTVGISIMVLLALSSHRAREYATRGRHLPKRIAGRPYAPAAISS
jgi:hypothetical protein